MVRYFFYIQVEEDEAEDAQRQCAGLILSRSYEMGLRIYNVLQELGKASEFLVVISSGCPTVVPDENWDWLKAEMTQRGVKDVYMLFDDDQEGVSSSGLSAIALNLIYKSMKFNLWDQRIKKNDDFTELVELAITQQCTRIQLGLDHEAAINLWERSADSFPIIENHCCPLKLQLHDFLYLTRSIMNTYQDRTYPCTLHEGTMALARKELIKILLNEESKSLKSDVLIQLVRSNLSENLEDATFLPTQTNLWHLLNGLALSQTRLVKFCHDVFPPSVILDVKKVNCCYDDDLNPKFCLGLIEGQLIPNCKFGGPSHDFESCLDYLLAVVEERERPQLPQAVCNEHNKSWNKAEIIFREGDKRLTNLKYILEYYPTKYYVSPDDIRKAKEIYFEETDNEPSSSYVDLLQLEIPEEEEEYITEITDQEEMEDSTKEIQHEKEDESALIQKSNEPMNTSNSSTVEIETAPDEPTGPFPWSKKKPKKRRKSKWTVKSDVFSSHKPKVTAQTRHCTVCWKKFPDRDHLIQHQRKHPQCWKICFCCGKTFTAQSKLGQHIANIPACKNFFISLF